MVADCGILCVQVRAKRSQKGQFAPLKEEFQQKAAFSYLSK